ncbi:MAG: hypothetical protein RI572_10705 [Salegentibacter sp.]|uniref:Uncharacterized protein n=1 Tax=Salegentibacter flavus TaxID=287099 RepID=A0A1I5CVA7_9FLAO|nr:MULTISPECIES: hypothetical protein [Salegentibacter]MDR9457865.1 hypothetical protein [Salegentibacter sp.]SFN90889.1 hypothetical protein SAMN05660413_03024 [Salegentibacter flavus]
MEKSKRDLIIQTLSFAITFVIAFFAVQYFFFDDKNLEEQLTDAAREVNNISPKMVDEYSRLDSASTVSDQIFKYHYTLVNMSKKEVDSDTVEKYIRPGIIENVKTSPDLKDFRDNNITMSYNYYDKNGDFVLHIDVTPDLY